MPDRESIRKWEAALRDGDLPQCQDELTSIEAGPDGTSVVRGHCCLGVACITAIKDGVGIMVEDSGSSRYYDGGESSLPPATMQWLGLHEEDPTLVSEEGEPLHASYLNDRLGYSFKRIADAIRRTWPEFFEEMPA